MPHSSSSPDAAAATRRTHPLNADGHRVLMLVNRKAGAGRRRAVVQRVVDALEQRGLTVTVISDLGQLGDVASKTQEAGDLRAVISAGGDGTVSAALNATPPEVPLALLPLGTENLLARYLGHRPTPQSIVELMTNGVVAPLDAAKAGDRLFAIVFSAGLDADVVRRVHENRRGNITHLAYAGPLLQALGGYRYPRVTVTSVDPEDEPFSSTGCWTFAVNLPSYALQIPLAPDAVGTDGRLDLCQLERGSLGAGLWYLWHVLRRRHQTLASVHTARRTRFLVESADGGEVPYQVDGDSGGILPVEIASLPCRMQLVVTPAVASGLGFASIGERD